MGIYIGIDPGLSGGMAALTEAGRLLQVHRMPETDQDILAVLREFRRYTDVEGYARVMIEKVGVMPKQGIVSAFTFGRGVGALHMALAAVEMPYDQVLPRTWQQAMGCLSGGDKNITKRRAQALFPVLTITHAIADALLIAEYCRRQYGTAASTSRGERHYGKESSGPAQEHTEAGTRQAIQGGRRGGKTKGHQEGGRGI